MNQSNNYLEPDANALNTKLRFVKNEFEEELNDLLNNTNQPKLDEDKMPYKVIKPDPGMCVKAFKLIDNDKCFLNICKSSGIPPPEDITADQLTTILGSETPGSYKIPMSISELRTTSDKSGNSVNVCDVAINSNFYRKIENLVIFRDFLITIIFEGLDTKYNMQVNRDSWIILKNRKSMGSLVSHRIQNRDVKTVYDSYQNTSEIPKALIEGPKSKSLITEIPKAIQKVEVRAPQYRAFRKCLNGDVPHIVAEVFLPEIHSEGDIILDLGKSRLAVEALRGGYLLDAQFQQNINPDHSEAEFNVASHVLTVKMPILC